MPGGTPYISHGYVPPQRVWFLRRFGLKTGIDFAHFGLERGLVFKGTTARVRTHLLFQFQMKEKYANLKWNLRNLFCCCL